MGSTVFWSLSAAAVGAFIKRDRWVRVEIPSVTGPSIREGTYAQRHPTLLTVLLGASIGGAMGSGLRGLPRDTCINSRVGGCSGQATVFGAAAGAGVASLIAVHR